MLSAESSTASEDARVHSIIRVGRPKSNAHSLLTIERNVKRSMTKLIVIDRTSRVRSTVVPSQSMMFVSDDGSFYCSSSFQTCSGSFAKVTDI